MIRTTFNKLREVKDSLPKGSSAVIAEELGITADDVRAYFNGTATVGYHIEQGPDGGIVILAYPCRPWTTRTSWSGGITPMYIMISKHH